MSNDEVIFPEEERFVVHEPQTVYDRRMNLDRSEALEQAINEGNELISIFVRSIDTARKKSRR